MRDERNNDCGHRVSVSAYMLLGARIAAFRLDGLAARGEPSVPPL
jgi:hypothetical protein